MEELFLKLVNLSVTASYLVFAVIVLRLVLKKAPKWGNCALWGLVALRLLCPFRLESVFSLVPSAEPIPRDFIYAAQPRIYSGFSAVDEALNPLLSAQLSPAAGDSVNPLQVWSFVLSRVWLVGLCAMLAYACLSRLLLQRRIRTATILEGNIRQSEFVDAPFVLGLFRPRIYLPYRMDIGDLPYVTAHEQAHIKRRDNWWKPLGFLLLSVHWLNPVMWAAYILLCRDIEAACDERVIRDMQKEERQAYSAALLHFSVHRKRIAACPLAFGEVSIKERIRSVMNYRKPAFWMVTAAVLACVAASVCFLTNPREEAAPDAPNQAVFIAIVKAVDIDETTMTVIGADDGFEYLVNLEHMEPLSAPAAGDTIQIIHTGGILDTEPIQFENVLKISLMNHITESAPDDSLEKAISEAILIKNRGRYLERDFACESHMILATESGCAAGGGRVDTIIVYASVLYQEYSFADGKIASESSGSLVPAALTFAVDENGKYTLTEYWEPRDGSYYAKDIRSKFPGDAAETFDTQNYILPLTQSCYAQAVEYGNLRTDRIVEELLSKICASPFNADGYVEGHSLEYRELLYYGDYTLNYIFRAFLSGGQTDARGQVMRSLLDALAPELTVALEATDGQAYFDAVLSNIEQIRAQRGEIWIRESMPYGWMLLQMINPFDAIPAFDAGRMDIDGDGIIEQYAITIGPTSGLFTFCIQADADGAPKYSNRYSSCAYGKIYFEKAEDGRVYLVTVDFQGTEKRFAVSAADGSIALTGLTETDADEIHYWGPQGVDNG